MNNNCTTAMRFIKAEEGHGALGDHEAGDYHELKNATDD